MRGTGNGPVDAGELTAVFFVPLPDGGGGVGGGNMETPNKDEEKKACLAVTRI